MLRVASITGLLFLGSAMAALSAVHRPTWSIQARRTFGDVEFRLLTLARSSSKPPGQLSWKLECHQKPEEGNPKPVRSVQFPERRGMEEGEEGESTGEFLAYSPARHRVWFLLGTSTAGANQTFRLYMWDGEPGPPVSLDILEGTGWEVTPSASGRYLLIHETYHASANCCWRWLVMDVDKRRSHLLKDRSRSNREGTTQAYLVDRTEFHWSADEKVALWLTPEDPKLGPDRILEELDPGAWPDGWRSLPR